MKAQDIMRRDVVVATPDMSLAQARRQMDAHHMRHLPVMAGTRLVGLVTDRDIRDAMPSAATTLSKAEITYHMDATSMKTCMIRDVVSVRPEADGFDVIRTLLDHKIGCVPVVDKQRLVGIITEMDCLQAWLASPATSDAPQPGRDRDQPEGRRRGSRTQVKDYMQDYVITLYPEDRVRTAYQRRHGGIVRHLPVIDDDNKLVGIVTDRDIRQAGASTTPPMAAHEWTSLLEKMTVQDMMTTQVHTVRAATSLVHAGRLLLTHKFGCLPVVRDDNTLEGIITVTDLLSAYVQQHDASHPSDCGFLGEDGQR